MLQRPPSFVISLALGEECPAPLSTPEVLRKRALPAPILLGGFLSCLGGGKVKAYHKRWCEGQIPRCRDRQRHVQTV